MTSNLFIVPANDLEGVTIIDLLRRHQQPVLVTAQPWGASWAGLEPEITSTLRSLPPETRILGVELAGHNPFSAIDIDHHSYRDQDRWRPDSSLEQVAALLNITLSWEETLIAANDRGYIPAMRELGASQTEIDRIRLLDRQAQGITPEDELRAERDVARAIVRGRRAWLDLDGDPTSAHGDRLFSVVSEWMLAGHNRWSYSGPRHKQFAASISSAEQHWCGGAPSSGFAGVASPSLLTRDRLRSWFWL